jgi:hypothetical protein
MKSYNGDRLSSYISNEKNRRLAKLKEWREDRLVLNLLVNILIPLIFLSFLSYIFPWFYVIMPVY